MSEKSERSRVIAALAPLRAFSVENRVNPGTPDVAHLHGWIELKQIEDWPKRPSTMVRIDHYTPEQRLFLRRWWEAGGLCHLLLRVEATDEWLLFEGHKADLIGACTQEELMANYISYYVGGVMEDSLLSDIRYAFGSRLVGSR